MDIIRSEADKMGIPCGNISLLQHKDGILVARIESGARSYVIKCFQREDFRREITNYRILRSLGIPTIDVIADTDSALLLEDIDSSPVYRLGTAEDMDDLSAAKSIAQWYRELHQRGYAYVSLHGAGLYDEAAYFTKENIRVIAEKTGTQAEAVWRLLGENFDTVSAALKRLKRTLTYNDFYYTNLVVARDRSRALMFDYNLLGKGYAYSDLGNVMFSLSARAKDIFLQEYGAFDPLEAAVDHIVAPIVGLYFACRRSRFPSWAAQLMEDLPAALPARLQRLTDLN